MSTFQDDLAADVALTFLNPREFGREIVFNGMAVTAVVEDGGHSALDTGAAGGFENASGLTVLESVRTVYLAADALHDLPVPDQEVDLDGEIWAVCAESNSVRVDDGMLIIKLTRSYA